MPSVNRATKAPSVNNRTVILSDHAQGALPVERNGSSCQPREVAEVAESLLERSARS
jgi:hypothetical protein